MLTCGDIYGDRGTVREGLLLCSHCKAVESAWSQTRKQRPLTESLLHLENASGQGKKMVLQ